MIGSSNADHSGVVGGEIHGWAIEDDWMISGDGRWAIVVGCGEKKL
jgi:hypothetical protein